MVPLKRPAIKWILAAVLLAAVGLAHPIWLAGLGHALVQVDPPAPADAAIVLGGDGFGYRILKAAELVRQHYAPLILVSGPDGLYGYYESELAIEYAVRAGYPASWFVGIPHSSRSTQGEARVLAPELRKRGIRSCLLVTSYYHTRRAGRVFRSTVPEVQFRVIGADAPEFDPDGWWHTREGRKTVLLEWEKVIASWFGI